MSDKDTSTLQSYVDSATSAVQSAIGSITGNAADKDKAEQTKSKAQAENDLSHTAAKVGPATVSSSGAVTTDNPDRTQGSWNQTVGSGKEMLGNLVGAEGLKQQGIDQNRAGKEQEAQGQLSDLGSGVTDRAKGAVGGALAGFTGDREEQEKRQAQHDAGKTQQRGVEADLQKQADAQQKS
ncbi:MAG: hypothetical protein M1821_006483 [Bathelium mastoideum]|nr:MAG: hypothetical protein M1821_006483 [Bathelium mastoideum]KAI9693759.1 MAG: hypothetical protein M1822_003030 [Bathelium mastoideum]